MVLIDVFRPCGEPSYGVVVNNLLPVAGHVGYWNRRILPYVDGDVFRTHTVLPACVQWKNARSSKCGYLEEALLGVLSTTAEQTRRFNSEVPNLLFTSV